MRGRRGSPRCSPATDLACLQEIKTSTGEFPAGDFAAVGYQAAVPVAARCTAVTVDRDERKPTAGESKPSDHAPVIITLTADGR